MATVIQIELPSEAVAQLEEVARQQQRSVDEVVRAMIMHELPGLPPLPEEIEAELAAFDRLSDDVLWLLAGSTLTTAQQVALSTLNEAAQERDLSEAEAAQQQTLLDAYNRVLVRRAQAAAILKARGNESDSYFNGSTN